MERLQGTLIYNAGSILKGGKLNHKYWEDIVRTANYIHNRLPHADNNNKVPFEELYNRRVDYDEFRVFECQVFIYVPKQFRKKFNGTSLPGIFLGYDETNPTAYIIYDTTNNKIVLARTVEFFEDVPGNASAPPSTPEMFYFNRVMDEEEEKEEEQMKLNNDYNKEGENEENIGNTENNKLNSNLNNTKINESTSVNKEINNEINYNNLNNLNNYKNVQFDNLNRPYQVSNNDLNYNNFKNNNLNNNTTNIDNNEENINVNVNNQSNNLNSNLNSNLKILNDKSVKQKSK